MLTSIRGSVVAVEARPFKGFTDNQGRAVASGVSNRLHLVESFDRAPLEVRCNADQAEAIRSLGAGAVIVVELETQANGNQLRSSLIGFGVEGKSALKSA